MKTIMCLCMMAGLLFSCGEDDAVGPASNFLPKTVGIYFQLKDSETNRDLFLNNDSYHINSVANYGNDISDMPIQDAIWHEQQGDSTILRVSFKLIYFGDNATLSNHILHLSNVDYDTLTIAYSASREYVKELEGLFNSPYSTRLDRLQVFYNGELINDWYLKDDEDLRQRILGTDNPPINVIYKKPEKRTD